MTAEQAAQRYPSAPGRVAHTGDGAGTTAGGGADGEPAGAKLLLMSELASAPPFRMTLRGYDRQQVDRFAHLVQAELETRRRAHEELAADVRSLAAQLDEAHEELAILRRRPSVDDTIAFKHLGPRVEQILAQAHAEADEIRAAATRSAAQLRTTSEEEVRAIQAEHDRAVAEFEQRRRWLREEEERWTRLLRSRQEQVARAEHYRRKVQEAAEEILQAATEQQERIISSATRRCEQLIEQATAQANRIVEAARRQAEAERAAAREPVEEDSGAGH